MMILSLLLLTGPPLAEAPQPAPADSTESLDGDLEIAFEDATDPFGGEAAGEQKPRAPASQATRVVITMSSQGSVDLAHEAPTLGPPEQFAELLNTLRLEITHKLNPRQNYRIKVKNRVLLSTEFPGEEGWRTNGKILPELDQLRLDSKLGSSWSLRAGLQRVDWGFVDASSPATIFAPPDLRFGFGGERDDNTLPVMAGVFRLAPKGSQQRLEIAWNPLYRPPELMIFGGDWAMQAPNRPPGGPMGDLSWAVDRSVAPRWQTNLTYLSLPELNPKDHSLALRGSGRVKGFEWGLFGFYGFDLFPVLTMDEDLAWLLANTDLLNSAPIADLVLRHPELLERMEGLTAKLGAAQEDGSLKGLVTATPHRIFQIGGQFRKVMGAFVFALESTWTPNFSPCRSDAIQGCRDHFGGGRALFDLNMQPVRRPTLYSALQLEWQRKATHQIILVITDFMVADVAQLPLAFLDSSFINDQDQLERPFDASNAHLLTVTGAWRSQHLDERLEVLLSVVSHPVQGDYMAMGRGTWRMDDGKLQLNAGLEIFGGPSTGMFGQFNHNDRFTAGIKVLQ